MDEFICHQVFYCSCLYCFNSILQLPFSFTTVINYIETVVCLLT